MPLRCNIWTCICSRSSSSQALPRIAVSLSIGYISDISLTNNATCSRKSNKRTTSSWMQLTQKRKFCGSSAPGTVKLHRSLSQKILVITMRLS